MSDRIEQLLHEADAGNRPPAPQPDLTGYWFRPAQGGEDEKLRDELARKRAWPFEVRRVETRRILFTREPLREPVVVAIETPTRELRLALDARGELRAIDCERESCAASR